MVDRCVMEPIDNAERGRRPLAAPQSHSSRTPLQKGRPVLLHMCLTLEILWCPSVCVNTHKHTNTCMEACRHDAKTNVSMFEPAFV